MNASLKSVQSTADAERQARIDLAACYRLAAHFGLNEGIDNHLTLLVPGHADRFLLAPFGLHWSEVKASDFMVIDFDGKLVSGPGPVEDTALLHPPARAPPGAPARAACCTRICLTRRRCPCSRIRASRWRCRARSASTTRSPTTPITTDSRSTHGEGERMARALGTKSVLMMAQSRRARGGRDRAAGIPAAVFSRACVPGSGARTLDTGGALRLVPEKVVRTTAAQFSAGGKVGGRDRVDLHFDALKRMLDRSQADYAS